MSTDERPVVVYTSSNADPFVMCDETWPESPGAVMGNCHLAEGHEGLHRTRDQMHDWYIEVFVPGAIHGIDLESLFNEVGELVGRFVDRTGIDMSVFKTQGAGPLSLKGTAWTDGLEDGIGDEVSRQEIRDNEQDAPTAQQTSCPECDHQWVNHKDGNGCVALVGPGEHPTARCGCTRTRNEAARRGLFQDRGAEDPAKSSTRSRKLEPRWTR